MDHIEQRILEIIEQNAERIKSFGDDIWKHAELGFAETRTSQKFAEQLEQQGLTCQREIAVTGVKSYLKEKKEGELCISLMGELDGLPITSHPEYNPETGAVHACGHNAQLTGVMGAMIALTGPEVCAALDGNIAFIGVPAEEGSTPAIRKKLMDEGKIRFSGGKCEFIRAGAMDDISLTVGHHIMGNGKQYGIGNSSTMGFLEKEITYTGIGTHPGFACKAVDAQNAATLATHAVELQREGMQSFHGSPAVFLLHGMIERGAKATNIISDHVDMEYNMRAMSVDQLLDMSYRVDRSINGAAIATGAGVEVRTIPGYMPYVPISDTSVISKAFEAMDPQHEHEVVNWTPNTLGGTSDYGDLSCIMPVMQFYTGGHTGGTHTIDYHVVDQDEYYLAPAKAFALIAYHLLKDGAKEAKRLIAENKPSMTAQEYVAFMEGLQKSWSVDMKPVPEFTGHKDSNFIGKGVS